MTNLAIFAVAAGGGPTLLGIDVLWVATILAGVASVAVFLAIYAAVTVRNYSCSMERKWQKI